ncbi:hypothetical protein CH341_26980 [Rhodoplanes roseus]|uniref:DUF2865 domain-containing protein n=1 Tax=Rhodoplanes roseus TaxID=29409 RepID=A0A327KMU5_9BRAD|nr:hypothetical protein CH341_26980 [Rhodoplanes roseus]
MRTCDGFYIPMPDGSGTAEARRSCDSLCPGTETMVFRGGDDGPDGIADAVSSNGRRYGSLSTAFAHRTSFNPACRCGAGNGTKSALARLRQDATLVRGDIVVTEAGVHVFTGRGRTPHAASDFTPYDEAGRLPGKLKQYLSEIDRAYAHAPERAARTAGSDGQDAREATRAERRAERRARREAARAERAAARAERAAARAAREPAGDVAQQSPAETVSTAPVTVGRRP